MCVCVCLRGNGMHFTAFKFGKKVICEYKIRRKIKTSLKDVIGFGAGLGSAPCKCEQIGILSQQYLINS